MLVCCQFERGLLTECTLAASQGQQPCARPLIESWMLVKLSWVSQFNAMRIILNQYGRNVMLSR